MTRFLCHQWRLTSRERATDAPGIYGEVLFATGYGKYLAGNRGKINIL
jgi:hypothetical protein